MSETVESPGTAGEKVEEVKFCPIMTAGNVIRTEYCTNQLKVRCMGKACGMWSEYFRRCGLIHPS